MRAHAKINLTLRVLAARPDGYHALRTVFQSLDLHDTLEFDHTAGPFGISTDDPSVPVDERNLVWRAAALVWEAAGRAGAPSGVQVRLGKRIPAQGGLGGGSADAAAALVAFAGMWRGAARREFLEPLARRLGADVPFFLRGGTMLGEGRGDEMTPLRDLPRRDVVLVLPGFGIATPEAYGWLDQDRSSSTGVPPVSPGRSSTGVPPVILRLCDGTPVEVVNDLEAPVAARRPEIAAAREQLMAAGAEAAAMSGSGSTVFGLFRDATTASRSAAALAAAGWRTVTTSTVGRERAAPGFLV